jgi:hypothetical protein
MLVDPATGQATRIGRKLDENGKFAEIFKKNRGDYKKWLIQD